MKKDILTRKDIKTVVLHFYKKVNADSDIHFFFSKVVQVDWDKHVIVMCDFWENVLFYSGDYNGNLLETHKRIDALHKTESIHFQKWLNLFFISIDELYEGPNAQKMKQHALAIADVMQQKL